MAGKVATFSLCNATRIAVKRAKIIQVMHYPHVSN